jgi:hypothetical protein
MLGGKPMRVCLPAADIKDGPVSPRFRVQHTVGTVPTEKSHLGCGPCLRVITDEKPTYFLGIIRTGTKRTFLPQDKIMQMFNGTSAFGIAELVHRMWFGVIDISVLGPLGFYDPAASLRSMPRIVIRPNLPCMEGCNINAFYRSSDHSLNFPVYRKRDGTLGYVANSFDVVAHEVGHACLDGMCPIYNARPTRWTRALHESFSDMSALFSTFQLASHSQLVMWCKNPKFCVGYTVSSCAGGQCIRDVMAPRKALMCHSHHDVSQALTDFVCRAMHAIYSADKDLEPEQVISGMRRNVLRAVLTAQMQENPFIFVGESIYLGLPEKLGSRRTMYRNFLMELTSCMAS